LGRTVWPLVDRHSCSRDGQPSELHILGSQRHTQGTGAQSRGADRRRLVSLGQRGNKPVVGGGLGSGDAAAEGAGGFQLHRRKPGRFFQDIEKFARAVDAITTTLSRLDQGARLLEPVDRPLCGREGDFQALGGPLGRDERILRHEVEYE
jgi:hypothetical protein